MPVTFPPGEWLEMHSILPEYAMLAVNHVMVSRVDERGDEHLDGMTRMYTFIFVLREGPFDEGEHYLERTVAFTVPEGAALAMARVATDYAEGRRSIGDEPVVQDEMDEVDGHG